LIGVLASAVGVAQTSGGIFRGEVRDSSNAVIQQAIILIRSTDNGTGVPVTSNSEGLYTTPTLVPGSYLLTATKDSFQTTVFGPVELQVNQTVRVDFALSLGTRSDSIHVDASGEQLLSTESSQLSQIIASKQVSEIPLNGRQWQQLIVLSAGVNPGAPGESGSPNSVNISGQRSKANLYLVDGISTTSSAQGRGNSFNIPIDAVREFSVQSGAYSAEFGDVAGGVINLQSRSGTNQWHGSLFEFFRNNALDAANFFSNATRQPQNALRYNQFGGAVGGPIRRGKTFVFGDYQGTITHTATPMVTSLPSNAQRLGDFSGLRTAGGALIPIYDPFGASTARTPFPGSLIPAGLIDPAAAKISAMLPQPNQFDANGQPLPFNNYAATPAATSATHSFDFRADHELSPGNSVFLRYSFQNTDAMSPSIFGQPLGGTLLGAGTTYARNQNAGFGHIWQVGPSLINEAKVGLNRAATSLTQADYGQNLAEQFGIPGVNQSSATSGLPSLAISGLFNLGDSLLTPLRLLSTASSLSEKISWAKGIHLLRAGVDYQHEMGSTGYLVYGRGFYTFLNLTTSTAVGAPGGSAFASFLVGAPYQVLRDEFPPGLVGLISNRYGFYVQDDIKFTPRLTVNIGVRYDIMPYPSEMHDRLSNFDPATGTILVAGVNTNRQLIQTDFRDLAPRIGLAWVPRGSSTVIRAGYGIGFVDPLGGEGVLNSNEFNIPFYYLNNITQFPFTAPTYKLSNLLPALVMPSPLAPSGNQRYLDPNGRNQYSQSWSFAVQRAFNPSLMGEVAYVGTSGNRLLTASNINAGLPGPTNPALRQPFGPALGEIRALSNSAHSTYHGLQSKMERRFSSGLYFLGSYTWSKAIDNQSNGTDTAAASGQYPQDSRDPGLDRGLSSFDRTHRFVASAVWSIPIGHGAAFGARLPAAANSLLGGWQLSGVLVAQTGSPFSILMSCADINSQGNNCRPNRTASGELTASRPSIGKWFDTSAFAIPSPQAYGSAGRNILRAPGSSTFDLGLSRSFAWGRIEGRRVQVRADFFNALNHTNLGLPVNSIDSPAFGTIVSSARAREIQLGARIDF
jgi:hypothetical protein